MILSIDQALANSGVVVFNKKGKVKFHKVIKTASEKKKRNIADMDDKSRRTRDIVLELDNIISKYEVEKIVCEVYGGFSQSKVAADALATARTIIVCLSQLRRIPTVYINAMDGKKALTGNKNASKVEMCKSAKEKYSWFSDYTSTRAKSGFAGEAEHVADAVGLYLAARDKVLV